MEGVIERERDGGQLHDWEGIERTGKCWRGHKKEGEGMRESGERKERSEGKCKLCILCWRELVYTYF